MALQNDTSRVQYNGNNSTTNSYAIPFLFFENSHIRCVVTNSSGVDTELTLGSGFTVNGAGNTNGGSLKTVSAVPTSSKVTIFRNVPATQTTSYQEGGPFPAASHERALDKLTMLAQQTKRLADRALKVPETQSNPNDLPNAGSGQKLLVSNSGTMGWEENRNPPPYPATAGTQALVTAGSGSTPSWQTIPSIAPGPITATGSTAPRFLGDRSADWLNVKDFGAKGDGINDDAPAFRAAAQIAYNTGKTVFFPTGTYKLSSTTTGATSIPSGFGSVIRFVNNSNSPKTFSVIGDNATLTTPLYPQQYLSYGDEFTLIHLMGNFSSVHIEGINFVCTQPLYSSPTQYGRTFCIFMSGGDGELFWSTTIRPRNVDIIDCSFTDFIIGCRVDNAENMRFDRCSFFYTKGKPSVGVSDFSVGVSSRQVRGLSMTNCVFDGCTSKDLSGTNFPGNETTCSDGLILAYRGMYHGSEGLIISNNYIRNFGYEAIYIIGFIENTTTPPSLTQNRIYKATLITNNIIDGSLPVGVYPTANNYGIRTDAAQTIISNNFISNVNAPIMVSSNVIGSPKDTEYGLAAHHSIVKNNLINLVNGNRLGSKACVAIQVAYAEGIIIEGNIIFGENVDSENQRGWNGDFPRTSQNSDGSGAMLSIPAGISVGGGAINQYGRYYVRNNHFKIVSRKSPSVLSSFLNVDGSGVAYVENNIVENSDFFAYRQGGNNIYTHCKNNAFINGRRLCSSYVADAYENLQVSNQSLFWYPKTTGWHQIRLNARRNMAGRITLSASPEVAVGDPVFGGISGNQNSEFAFAAFSKSDGDVEMSLTQLVHAGGSNPLVTKAYLEPAGDKANLYIYVPRITQKVRLSINGGGGNGASANATIVNGVITGIADLVGGSGYTSEPSVSVEQEWSLGGRNASFTASISNGSVSSISVTNGGSGYVAGINFKFEADAQEKNAMTSLLEIVPFGGTPSNGVELEFSTGFKSISKSGNNAPVGIGYSLTGTSAPSVAPNFVGQVFVNTTNDKVYVATGTSSADDWNETTNIPSGDEYVLRNAGPQYNASNSTTLVDTGASLYLPVGQYSVRVYCCNGNASHVMGMKAGLTFTGTASSGKAQFIFSNSDPDAGYNEVYDVYARSYNSTVEIANSGTWQNITSGATLTIEFYLNVTVAGTLKLRAAQQTAEAANFRIEAGQNIVAVKL